MEPQVVNDSPHKYTQVPLLELEDMVFNYKSDIEIKKEKLKTKKEMVKDILLGDSEYCELEIQVKELTKKKNAKKSSIMSLSGNKQIVEEIKEESAEIRESQSALSDYLREYSEKSGANTLEDRETGEVLTIVKQCKLVKDL